MPRVESFILRQASSQGLPKIHAFMPHPAGEVVRYTLQTGHATAEKARTPAFEVGMADVEGLSDPGRDWARPLATRVHPFSSARFTVAIRTTQRKLTITCLYIVFNQWHAVCLGCVCMTKSL
jgi:hypothetical protein